MKRFRTAAVIVACLDRGRARSRQRGRGRPSGVRARRAGDGLRRGTAATRACSFAARPIAAACPTSPPRCSPPARRSRAGRAASSPLGDRLIATEALLNAYRAALIAAGAEAFARKRRGGEAPWSLGLSAAEKYAIADATGALLALEAIRLGL